MREWLMRLRDWARRDKLDAELDDELRFHRAQLERDASHEGLPAGEAARRASRRLGNVTRVHEEARDRWSIPWLDHFQQDVRYALRSLFRTPIFTLTVILTLALGIGANAAMFSVVDQLMFRPYPGLRDPGRVHRVYLQWSDRNRRHTDRSTEYTRYLDLSRGTTAFSQAAAFANRTMAVGTGEAARELPVAVVSASFFAFFDAPAVRGRYFTASEDTTPRGADVAVLGYSFWKSGLGGRDVLGQVLQVGNISATIIGVAPEGFTGVNDEPTAVFVPITTYAGSNLNVRNAATYFTSYNWGWMSMMVRRKAGVGVNQASADLSEAFRRSWIKEQELYNGRGTPAELARPQALAGAMRPNAGPDPSLEARTALWVSGVALIVLLIAAANTTNLMLARALRRRRETAVRLALGVSRGRLLAQSLAESLTLAVLGSAAGLLVAQWGGAGIRRMLVDSGVLAPVLTDRRTILVAAVLALVVGLLTGMAPALLAGREDLSRSLKAGARDGGQQRSRMRGALLVLQGALSVVLLIGAALFVRSLSNVRAMPMGYDAGPVLLASANLRSMPYSDSGQARLGRELLQAGQSLPGVEHAAWVSTLPFWSTSIADLYVEGIDSVQRLGDFTYQATTPDYFAAMGTRILRGRAFTADDRAGSPKVVVVSESMARVLWPGRDALGACLRVGGRDSDCTTVIGVAEDMIQEDLTGTNRMHYYVPIVQREPGSGFALLLRMRGDAAAQAEFVRKSLQPVMPGTSYIAVTPFSDIVEGQRASWRMGATMFVAFGVLALVVAAVGLYGVIGYNVTQRMHELGVRVALGAQTGDIMRLVVNQAVRFAVAGVLAGTALAWVLGRFVEPLLFRQPARDPLIYAAVAAMMVLVALAASASPALRASRADPNSALRSE